MSNGGIEPRAIEALGWNFIFVANAGVEPPTSLRLFTGLCEQQIPFGNDRQRGEGKSKGNSRSFDFATLRSG